MSPLNAIGIVLTGYVLGSFPSAVLIARARGRNVFAFGSGNMGAMNVARTLGWRAGAIVFALDVGKGAAAALLGGVVAGSTGGLLGGAAAVAGHALSAWVGGRGGKALATALGAALPLYPAGAAAGLAVLLVAIGLLRSTTVASLVMLGIYPLLAAATQAYLGAHDPTPGAVATGVGAIAAISGARHAVALRREVASPTVTGRGSRPPAPSR